MTGYTESQTKAQMVVNGCTDNKCTGEDGGCTDKADYNRCTDNKPTKDVLVMESTQTTTGAQMVMGAQTVVSA
jgi:hypothetical protein